MVLLVGLTAAVAAAWANWSTIEGRLDEVTGNIERGGAGQSTTAGGGTSATDTPESSGSRSEESGTAARDETTGEIDESSLNGVYAFDSEHYDVTTDSPTDFVAGLGTITIDLAAEQPVTGTLWLSFAVESSEDYTDDWMFDISSTTRPVWDEASQQWTVSLVITSDQSEAVQEDAVIRSGVIQFSNPEFVFVRD